VVAIETAVAREGLSWIWLQLFDKKKKERKKKKRCGSDKCSTNKLFNFRCESQTCLQFPANVTVSKISLAA